MFYKQLSHVLRPTRSCLHLLHPLTISTTFLHFSYTLTALVQCSDTLVFFYTFSFSQPYESHTYCWYTGGILFHSCTPFHTFFLQNTISPACCWAHSCLFIPLLPSSYTSFHFYSPSSIFILLSSHKKVFWVGYLLRAPLKFCSSQLSSIHCMADFFYLFLIFITLPANFSYYLIWDHLGPQQASREKNQADCLAVSFRFVFLQIPKK